MKALSIRQPWAWHIIHDGKDIENRKWPTNYRGWFLIHAAKGVDPFDRETVRDRAMPLGGIVGMAEIVNCVNGSASEWFFGPYGFVLANVRPLPFMPCRGMLSFFTPDISGQVARHWHDGTLSEGQGAKILGIDRVRFRQICDEHAPF